MDENKIAFIQCINDSFYAMESRKYIEALQVPEGYEVDILQIEQAPSITSGYNYAMKQTNAKYKIYMHQDVFIVNKKFLYQMLEIFQNKKIGMFGMVGVEKLPECAVQWYGNRYGKIYSCSCNETIRAEFLTSYKGNKVVDVIDGLLMAVQYDVPWREDIIQGWDFYDVSQSKEYQKRGYQVVVPEMEEPWVIHDDGILNLSQYYESRRCYLRAYET